MSIELKLQSLAGYRDHLASQFKDRMANWTLQELSRDHLADVLCIQLDGMDQGKYALPRDPELRTSAAMTRVHQQLHAISAALMNRFLFELLGSQGAAFTVPG